MNDFDTHLETLEEQANHAIAEARTVLPGVQALLGFQLIAVFNQRFTELSPGDQEAHNVGFLLIALAAGLLMTPAAYHRQTGGEKIYPSFRKALHAADHDCHVASSSCPCDRHLPAQPTRF